jgi:hypothetical protein
MQRICALHAIESTAEIKMLGIVLIKRDYFILWECVKLVILVTIIR